jgi:alpha-tubulin suppressor-like RCC1 family protein
MNKKIIQISCGDHHSVSLTNDYQVFSWGGGGPYNKGQCGHGDLKDVETPKRIEFFKGKKVIKIICGGYHTMAVLEDNLLYGFGKGTYGQCGYGAAEDTHTPKLVKFSRNCLGFEQGNISRINDTSQTDLKEYKSPIKIKDVKCGGEHTIVLSMNGRVYTFGHGYTGQLGLGNNKNYERPTIVKSLIKKTINQIAAGWSHSIVLTSEGFIYISGCGRYGELYIYLI